MTVSLRPAAALPAALFAVLIAFSTPAAAQGRAALVDTDPVIDEPLAQTLPVLGRLVTRQSGAVASRIGGAIDQVLIDVGDRVAKGDEMVRLRADRFRANLALRQAERAEAEAALEAAEASLALAQQELARLERLRQSAAFSQARYDDQRQAVARDQGARGQAAARLAQARAQLELARIDLNDTAIRAPYAGVVSEKQVSPGDFVTAGTPVLTLVDDGELEIEADVPADNVAGLTAGRLVDVRFTDGEFTTSLVRAVVPDENPLTRTRLVRFTPDLAARDLTQLAVNQSVTLEIPVGEPRQVVSVHKDAVTRSRGANQVWVVVDGAVQPRTVTLGTPVGQRVEVLGGLDAGDVVVVTGNERLRPGQQIRTRKTDATLRNVTETSRANGG